MTSMPLGPSRFGTADLHAHTSHGDGMVDAETLLSRVEAATDLDVIAITDHDDVRGALLAREAHARGRYRFELVPGIELTTLSGHLLALWIDQPLRPFRSLEESVETIHRLGGVAVLPHPFSYLTRSVGRRGIERVLRTTGLEAHPDGIEVANSSLAGRVTGTFARRWNHEHGGFAETGGSDAHFPEEAGTSRTVFPGRTALELRAAILARRTQGVSGAPVPLRHIGVRRLALQQVRGLSVTPRKVLGPHVRRVLGMTLPMGEAR